MRRPWAARRSAKTRPSTIASYRRASWRALARCSHISRPHARTTSWWTTVSSCPSLPRARGARPRAVATWEGAERHFRVALARKTVSDRVAARLRWLPPAEGEYWNNVAQRTGAPADTLRFLVLSLDGAGRLIAIVNTDPAMLLLVDSLGPDRTLELIGPIMLPHPWGLFVDALGPVVANDAYATRDVWEAFRRDRYHSPTVVWGRDVNALVAGLARQLPAGDVGAQHAAPLQDALHRISDAVDRSGLRHAELWSYAIENGRLVPSRYGTSSDVDRKSV